MTTTALQRPPRSKSSLRWDAKAPRPQGLKDAPTELSPKSAKFWVWDHVIQDWLPRRRPCDFCDVVVEGGYTCDVCCNALFRYWEALSDPQATDLLLVAGLKNRIDVLLEHNGITGCRRADAVRKVKIKKPRAINGDRMMKMLEKLKESR